MFSKQRKTTRSLWPLIFSTLFLAGFIQGCSSSNQESVKQWPSPENCDLHNQACTATNGEAKATLEISPHPIPIARPLGIEVDVENLIVKKMELDISGVNMYMGYNRVDLSAASPNRYVGTSMLAFCTNEKMLWQITLMIETAQGDKIQIPYNLETINR